MGGYFAVDFGYCSTRIYKAGTGIVFNEPSLFAINLTSKKIEELGFYATNQIGKQPGYLILSRLLDRSKLNDPAACADYLEFAFEKRGLGKLKGASILISRSSEQKKFEMEKLRAEFDKKSIRRLGYVESALACSIAVGNSTQKLQNSNSFRLGAGSSALAVVSLGSVVANRELQLGSYDIDLAIRNYLLTKNNLLISPRTAEELKIAFSALYNNGSESYAEIRGRDALTGAFVKAYVEKSDIVNINFKITKNICKNLVKLLQLLSPEVSGDLFISGLNLSGGLSMVEGIEQLVTEITGVKARVLPRPLETEIDGMALLLEEHPDELKFFFRS